MKRQLTRWLIVGTAVYAALYLVYLGLTASVFGPRTAMTAVYVAGVLLGFIGHRHWSFEHQGRLDSALVRYLGAYLLGYVLNLAGLQFGIEVLVWPHQLVQGVMVVVVAASMFMMQKYFVFARRYEHAGLVEEDS